jgi:hypothetical protein
MIDEWMTIPAKKKKTAIRKSLMKTEGELGILNHPMWV